jgi:hypothetical protein
MIKGINGCKQGSKLFYEEVKASLQTDGFTMSLYDSCLFIKKRKNESCVIIVWVDDLLIATDSKKCTILDELLDNLRAKYKYKQFANPTLFLGLTITRNRERKTLTLSQEAYFKELLEKFGMQNCNAVCTPIEHGKNYTKAGTLSDEEAEFMRDKQYRSLACSLMYPSTITRPDIAFATNTASRYLQNPNREHWQLLQRIMRYVKGTTELCLNYDAKSQQITGWPDASWGDNLDDRKSTGGYLFFIGNCLVSWASRKQGYVALSTNNAEFGALAEACKEAFYIRGIINEIIPSFLPASRPIQIFEDNEGTISQARNNILNSANRTIALKFHFVREEMQAKRVFLSHVTSQDQLADILTKALPTQTFKNIRDLILGQDQDRNIYKPPVSESTQESANTTTATAQTTGKTNPFTSRAPYSKEATQELTANSAVEDPYTSA